MKTSKSPAWPVSIAILALGLSVPALSAERTSYEIGVGLGIVDDAGSSGIEGGWDLLFGWEWREKKKWHLGSQLHLLAGWSSGSDVVSDSDLAYDSLAFNVTFRPKRPAASWIQLRTGLVYADFTTPAEADDGLGWTVGAGAMLRANSRLKLHLFDYSRHHVGGQGFNVYSISFAWCGILAGY